MKHPASLCLAAVLLVAGIGAAVSSPRVPQTVAEQSGFRSTGRYDEVIRLCGAYAEAWPDAVRCEKFGQTPQGRPMLALVVSRSGALTPVQAREKGIPVMLVQAGIHAGEIEGKDAGFLALRELLQNEAAPGALESFVFVFVPVFNVDGHERFGRWNRPNQNGPEEMGWRVTAQGFNLNRDYTKADAPEMRAMLALLDAWDPVLYVDLHATDGAQFEHDVANIIEPLYTGDPALQRTGRELLDALNAQLAQMGSLPLDFYPSFVREDDPASGFAVEPFTPRFSTGYWALRNRFALLVETHSWKDYPTRVRVTRNIIVTLAQMMAAQSRQWQTLVREADDRAMSLGGTEVPLDFDPAPQAREIDFRGYAYVREPSEVSGSLVTRYDPSLPQIWRVPLRDTVVPALTVRAPAGGYVVPSEHADWMAERLSAHGIRFGRLEKPATAAPVEAFRAIDVRYGNETREGRMTVRLEGRWERERRTVPAGSLFVPIAQPKARLVMALLEPQAPDSFASWGFFNIAFEAREYMEPYVAEELGRQMLAENPDIAAEFRRRLETDRAFAANPAARLEFFYRLHPSWDEKRNLYPIYRTDHVPVTVAAQP